jgi:hypothetical protein
MSAPKTLAGDLVQHLSDASLRSTLVRHERCRAIEAQGSGLRHAEDRSDLRGLRKSISAVGKPGEGLPVLIEVL